MYTKIRPRIVFTAFAGQKKKTKVIDNELDPVWNEVHDLIKCLAVVQLLSSPPDCVVGGALWSQRKRGAQD